VPLWNTNRELFLNFFYAAVSSWEQEAVCLQCYVALHAIVWCSWSSQYDGNDLTLLLH